MGQPGHPHVSAAAARRGRLVAVLGIALAFLVIEVTAGLLTGSLALLADAGHMLADVTGIGLALFALRLATRPATDERTFGLYRAEILAAAVNAVILLAVAGAVLTEAWRRMSDPPEVARGPMLVVAVAGLAANAVALWLLRSGQADSLVLRGAYLEVLGDLLGSVAVVGAAVTISLTGFLAADPIASVAIALLILPRTWHLLREAVDVLLEATPRGIDLAEVRRHILDTQGVTDVHDLHAWTITSGMNVVSAHVVLEADADPARCLDLLEACLTGDFDVEHSTFQLETTDRRRLEQAGHP